MIPILSHIEDHLGFPIWVTTDNRRGFTVRIESTDLEIDDLEVQLGQLRSWISNLDPRLLVRTLRKSYVSNEASPYKRSSSFQKLGYLKSECLLSIELSGEPILLKEVKQFLRKNSKIDSTDSLLATTYQSLTSSGFKIHPMSIHEIEVLFRHDHQNWVTCESYIDTGSEYFAVLRLVKPSSEEQLTTALPRLLDQLPCPFEASLSFRRMGAAETQLQLRKKIKQAESEKNSLQSAKLIANEIALEKTLLEGDSLLSVELLVALSRRDLKKLRDDLHQTQSLLSNFGEVMIETYGALPSFSATLVGSPQHVNFLEIGSNIGYYLPTLEFGSSGKTEIEKSKSSLSVYRNNRSRAEVGIFDREHLNANCLIVGASGRGKSGLVGTLTQSLLHDRDVTLIKVDVGGSHSKECELLGGTEYSINLNKPSGINPFEALKGKIQDESIRAILLNFLSVLILEDNETSLPKSVKLGLDKELSHYISAGPSTPHLTDFYLKAENLPRRELLSRWIEGGIYGRAFSGKSQLEAPSSRLRYYNFSEIFQAADPDFAQAGMAAVLAQFNLEMRINPSKRLVLVCDETPFFIQKCFEFFKFSTANVRKFGASVILVVQVSDNLIVNDDPGIIENSYHRLLMSVDGQVEKYRERFRLTHPQLECIKGLRSIPRQYSEFFYQFGELGFQSRLKLDPEEYWQITTTQSEKLKIEALLREVPGLKLEEAIKCLSLHG